jgi:hypothetical protein
MTRLEFGRVLRKCRCTSAHPKARPGPNVGVKGGLGSLSRIVELAHVDFVIKKITTLRFDSA